MDSQICCCTQSTRFTPQEKNFLFFFRLQKLNRMRALQARGAQVTAEEREIMDQLELALKETDASDDKVFYTV